MQRVGVIMNIIDSHFVSGISLASSFIQFMSQALRQFLPLVIRMATMCISQVCLGRSVCILFQKGFNAYRSRSDGMEPNNAYVCGD